MDIKIITVASEMTSNIWKLNNNNFHPESSIYMNSLRRHLSRIVIFPACAPKAILSPHSPTPSQKPLELFIFWIFMLCVVFFFSFFYIEPTIFCVRCAWQMAKSGEFAWLHVHTGIASLFVCLSGKWTNKERSNDKRPHTAIAFTQLTLLRSKWGRSAYIRCFHTHLRTHHSMPFLITRQVHSSIWIQTLSTPRVNWWMHVHPDISPIWGTS